jgi:hypothetical protein
MLIEPASKASVPLTVVMRTRSRVPPRAIEPAVVCVPATFYNANVPEAVQLVEFCKVIVTFP